jgi:hypothetical protein
MTWIFGGLLAIVLLVLLVGFWPVLRIAVYALVLIWNGILLAVGGTGVLGDPFIFVVFFLPWGIVAMVWATRAAGGMND